MSNSISKKEEGLIRSLLARPNELIKVIQVIDKNDFANLNFRVIYEAMLDLLLTKEEITLPSIALKISENGGAIDTGWLFDLEKNLSQWVTKGSPLHWAQLLKVESTRSKVETTLVEGMKEVGDATSNPLTTMDRISTELTRIAIETTSKDRFDIKEAVSRFRNETKELREKGNSISTISSAYPSLDYYTKGWGPTQLITIGARTGIGKSIFAINNATSALVQGKSVCFFSLEMTEREVISRIVSSISMVSIQRIEKAYDLSEAEEERVNEALEFIENSKLTIEDNPRVSIETIKQKSIEQAQSEDGLDFILIDYLQLIQNEGKRNRQEAVAEVSRSMKILAKELNVPVMVLVQLNRENKDNDGDNTPKIYDIRESGAIAQDSNIVILIHRDMETDSEIIDPKALFIIAKNRQGEANRFINVRTRLECSLFIDDNPKAQEMMDRMAESVEREGAFEMHDAPTSEYKNSLTNFDNFEMNDSKVDELFPEQENLFESDTEFPSGEEVFANETSYEEISDEDTVENIDFSDDNPEGFFSDDEDFFSF